ncbi:MAG: hypothetical protein AAGG48_09700 [Planctomycetota bacterium]
MLERDWLQARTAKRVRRTNDLLTIEEADALDNLLVLSCRQSVKQCDYFPSGVYRKRVAPNENMVRSLRLCRAIGSHLQRIGLLRVEGPSFTSSIATSDFVPFNKLVSE